MKFALFVLVGIVAWQFIGCFVLAALDGPKGMNGRLLEWVKACPISGWGVGMMLWPYVIWKVSTDREPAR